MVRDVPQRLDLPTRQYSPGLGLDFLFIKNWQMFRQIGLVPKALAA